MKLSATKVSQELDISVPTLTNWYKWYSEEERPEGCPNLPKYQQVGTRAPRLWDSEDIPELKAFKEWIPKGRSGVMGKVTGRYTKKQNNQKTL